MQPVQWEAEWSKQSTLVISTSLISYNRLSRSEIWPLFQYGKSIFSSFPQYFQYPSNFRSQLTYSFVKCGRSIYFFLNSANMICRGPDISKYFRESRGLRDKERLCQGCNVRNCVFWFSKDSDQLSNLDWRYSFNYPIMSLKNAAWMANLLLYINPLKIE